MNKPIQRFRDPETDIIEAILRLAPKWATGVYITSRGVTWGSRTSVRKFPENFFPFEKP
jgi:hypothetical protein